MEVQSCEWIKGSLNFPSMHVAPYSKQLLNLARLGGMTEGIEFF